MITMTSTPQLEASKHPPPVTSVLDNYWSVKAACFSPDVLNGCIPTETQVIPQRSSWTSSAAFRVTEKRKKKNNHSFRVSCSIIQVNPKRWILFMWTSPVGEMFRYHDNHASLPTQPAAFTQKLSYENNPAL